MSRSGRGQVSGPLAVYAAGFREELLGRGYTNGSAARLVQLMAHLSRWMDDAGIAPTALSATAVTVFTEDRRAEGYTGWRSSRALLPLLGYLRGLGVVPEEPGVVPATPVERMIARYGAFLVHERGLAPASVRSYLPVARRFLDEVSINEGLELEGLTAAVISDFVGCECRSRSAASAKVTVTGLRSLLRFLYLHGRTATVLTTAVPSVASWQLTGLPQTITPAETARLLRSCDRRTGIGRRDFAMIIMLVRLGLRAGEVAGLELGDLDWRQGEFQVRGKGRRHERLPLPVDVGEALAAWLRRGRPRPVASSKVFISMRAPHGPLSVAAVSAVVRRACRRAGVPEVGAHRLRHTAATDLVRAGASLSEVGGVLGHRRLITTAIYAKVDRAALAAMTQPWPAVSR